MREVKRIQRIDQLNEFKSRPINYQLESLAS